MTTINHFDVRRRLLNMNTREPLIIGALTIRFFKTSSANRWQIVLPDLITSFSYKVYPEQDYIMGTIDLLGERNDALAKATRYIMANYHGEQDVKLLVCRNCGGELLNHRATYCSAECSQVDSNRRYRERKSAERARLDQAS